ncbi:J domain-containing protein [Roseofilum casamattae]|uniref:J domain-containing protein n=1 Tax=Roseofilum casamattae BLCC-M143 TaxID=3022442 RepID=A0ABT7BZ62_9CYAN|nr:J domain-containing protein [Roseofilum casamattae]MDJ1184483.1 J domain-containing protein [Roseofilum casamattae BLCC-M143]
MNHYQTLEIRPTATAEDIRQAYRRLVKQFHPDLNPELGDRDRIININLAYEALSDPAARRHYDRQFYDRSSTSRHRKTSPRSSKNPATSSDRSHRNPDIHWQQWLKQVYHPVDRWLGQIIDAIGTEIDDLSADPFDDELLENFQLYLDRSRSQLEQAQIRFRSLPNPGPVASVAAHLYYCLDRIGDGLDEFNWFTQNYDDRYLHTGLELFRIASRLRDEAQIALQEIYSEV